MTPKTLRTVISVFLFVHAIGHAQGIVAALGIFKVKNWNINSWLFDPLLGEKVSQIIAIVLFSTIVLGFLATAFSFIGVGIPHTAWRTLAVIFMVPSVFSLIAYWNAFAMFFNKAGCIGVNTFILVGVLILNWPTEADLGL